MLAIGAGAGQRGGGGGSGGVDMGVRVRVRVGVGVGALAAGEDDEWEGEGDECGEGGFPGGAEKHVVGLTVVRSLRKGYVVGWVGIYNIVEIA